MGLYTIVLLLLAVVVLESYSYDTPKDQISGAKRDFFSDSRNWKECSWTNLYNRRDHGLIKDCVFYKKYNDSVLHVYWNGAFRVHSCDYCCKRWYFTFNGVECTGPRPIDGILYVYQGKTTQVPYRVGHIEGHCDKIHKGRVRVGLNVGNCAGYGEADASTGWNSNSRLFVEEVPRPQKGDQYVQ